MYKANLFINVLTFLTLIPEPLQHSLIVDNVADSEDSEDEWDYYRIDPNKQESAAAAAVEADESRKDIEKQSAQENPEFVVKDSSEVESPETENDIKCEELVKDTSSLELINIDVSICFVGASCFRR